MAFVTPRGRIARARAFYDNLLSQKSKYHETPGKEIVRRNYYLALAWDSDLTPTPEDPDESIDTGIFVGNIKAYHKLTYRLDTSSSSSIAVCDIHFCVPTDEIREDDLHPGQQYLGDGRFSYGRRSWTKIRESDILDDVEDVMKRIPSAHYIYISLDVDVKEVKRVLGEFDKINQLGIVSYLDVKEDKWDEMVISPDDLNQGEGFHRGYMEVTQNRSAIDFGDPTNDMVNIAFVLQF